MDQERRVRSTTTTTEDDAIFGKNLVKYASMLQDRALKLFLLEKSYEFAARDPSGYETALHAIFEISALDSGSQQKCRGWALELLRARYRNSEGKEKYAAGERLVRQLIFEGDSHFDSAQFGAAARLYGEAVTVARSVDLAAVVRAQEYLEQAEKIGPIFVQFNKLWKAKQNAAVATRLATIALLDLGDPSLANVYVAASADPQMARMAALGARAKIWSTPSENWK